MANPIFPLNEYVPDGEPRIFNNRLYIYGSHDKFNGRIFCMGDYVTYSCPLDDLGNFTYEGVIWKSKDDPESKGKKLMFAPDVIEYKGKYYMMYGLDFNGVMSVCVSSSPKGPFKYLGKVRHADGTPLGRKSGDPMPFDPALYVEDDKIYVFYGFNTNIPSIMTGFKHNKNIGGVLMELEDDFLTIKKEPVLLFPKKGEKGSWSEHAFFEASSIRKFDDTYYFIYSSCQNHEMCYATSKNIYGPYQFKSTLVDIGDCFLNGRKEKDALNYLGNTHGGMVKIGEDYYQVYHRHTNRHGYSRQVCVEHFIKDKNGDFKQHEITSLGFEKTSFSKLGDYSLAQACILYNHLPRKRYDVFLAKFLFRKYPAFTQDDKTNYISRISNNTVFGFRYFNSSLLKYLSFTLRGKAKGVLFIYDDEALTNKIGELKIDISQKDFKESAIIRLTNVKNNINAPLMFKYLGKGKFDGLSISLK